MMLCAELWPTLSGRLLFRTGLDWRVLAKRIEGTHAGQIRQDRLPRTKDFYADLIVTEGCPASSCNIDDVLKETPILCLYEFKYLTSFTTLGPKRARADAYKLEVLGEFIRGSTGQLPHLEQFIVASQRQRPGKRQPTVHRLKTWFEEPAFRSAKRNVVISILDLDGRTVVLPGTSEFADDCHDLTAG